MQVRGVSIYTAFSVVRNVLNQTRHVLVLLVATQFASAALYSLLEGKSLFDSLWWAVVTGWTVGYGDIYPVTVPGRTLAMVHIVWSSILWVIVTAHVLASVLVDKNAFTSDEQETVKATLLEIGQQLGVIDHERTSLPPAAEWERAGHYTRADSEEDEDTQAFGVIGDESP